MTISMTTTVFGSIDKATRRSRMLPFLWAWNVVVCYLMMMAVAAGANLFLDVKCLYIHAYSPTKTTRQLHQQPKTATTATTRLFTTSPSTPSSFDSKYFTPPEQSYYPRGNNAVMTDTDGTGTATTTTNSRSGVDGGVDSSSSFPSRITLQRFISNYVKDDPELRDLENVIMAVQLACKTISNLVHRAGLVYSIQNEVPDGGDNSSSSNGSDSNNSAEDYDDSSASLYSDGRYYSMKRLDKLSTAVLKNALKFTGDVKMIVPEAKEIREQPGQHQPGVLIAYDDHNLVCLDPLDGSGNADASICTGTVFGIFSKEGQQDETSCGDINGHQSNRGGEEKRSNIVLEDEASLLEAVLQPARKMRAAGYCLYSSATVLVFSLGSSVYGFTLDPHGEFVLTHDKLTIPKRGNVYSCNEANSEGWTNEGWKEYLRNLKLGEGETNQRYALRYVGSMVGDIHRTLLYGGIFAYPSNRLYKPQGNLQLLYKSAPLAFIMHHAGGEACDESGTDLLDIRPERIHQKSPVFMGSSNDMKELKKYLTKGFDKP